MGRAVPTIVFDFVNKAVVTAGTDAESDRQVREFIRTQQSQAANRPAAPAA